MYRRTFAFAGPAALLSAGIARATSPSGDRRAPARYAHVVGRFGGQTTWVYSNLRYEGNNRSVRGEFDPDPEDGRRNAQRYRDLAARSAGLFVLRDALFSQQDHPHAHRPCALMMPANWVSAAVDDTLAGKTLVPVLAPTLEDETAWTAIASAAEMFGGFPPSDALFSWASKRKAEVEGDERARVDNARASVRELARHARMMIDAAPEGPGAVARVGASCIAWSDREYFTPALRRDKVIVLGVENPNTHEIRDENKGIAIWGRTLDPRAETITRDAIYERRLEDGPLAIERYDLNLEDDRRRAIAVLTKLVPAGVPGHSVWVWVGGPMPEGTERAEDASHLLPTFEAELADAPIARDRVVVYNRPSWRMKGHTAADFEAAVDAFAKAGRPLSVNMSPPALRKVFDAGAASG